MQANHSKNQNRKAAEVLLKGLKSNSVPCVRTLFQNSSNKTNNKSWKIWTKFENLNTRRSEHCIRNLFLQLQRTQTKLIKFIWHSRLWAQRLKTLQETITFTDKRKSLLVIQIPEALWRKLNNLATKSVKFASEGQYCRPKTKPTENKYACRDLSVGNKRQKSRKNYLC